jgi:uncharacterized protein
MRLLIILGLLYLGYRALKSWTASLTSSKTATYNKTAGEIDDVMIKDPFCEVYFPKRIGIQFDFEGQELFFCSIECRDKFIDLHSQKKT